MGYKNGELYMILSYKQILDILVCPKTKQKLFYDKQKEEFSCDNIVYEKTQAIPLLIDFDNTVCNRNTFSFDAGKSAVLRTNYQSNLFMKWLKKIISPTPIQTIKNIQFLNASLKSEEKKKRLLIIGGGSIGRGCDILYNNEGIDIISFDVYFSEHITFIADAHSIPLDDNSVDAVLIQYVLEHVYDPKAVVREIYRVLKQGGIVYAETPFLEQVHEGAFDFSRFTHSGHRILFNNFEEIKSGVICGAGTHLLWSIEYLFRGIFRSRTIGKIIKLSFFWLQYIDIFIPEKYVYDMADSFYFLGEKSSSYLSIQSIVPYYRGADNN